MDKNLIYLDTYLLQQDMRIRMPKTILTNLGVHKGVSKFDILLDKEQNCLVLIPSENENHMEEKTDEQ